MATTNLQIQGLDRLQRYLSDRPDKLRLHIKRILSRAVLGIEQQAKLFTPVDTGRLRASIGGGSFSGTSARTGKVVGVPGSFAPGTGIVVGDVQASIGPTTNYAPFVHQRIPFMTMGVEAAIPGIKQFIQDEIKQALE